MNSKKIILMIIYKVIVTLLSGCGIIDELHQLFILGRSGVSDVFLDSTGSLGGVYYC